MANWMDIVTALYITLIGHGHASTRKGVVWESYVHWINRLWSIWAYMA